MVGATVSHYRLISQLGAGGMGAVYEALDTDLNRAVAIKFLPPECAGEPDRRERFLREARAAASLNHPNICTIHEVGHLGDELFIVMQLVAGETLASRIASGPIPAATLEKMAVQLAAGLGEAHRHGIVHRDLKPSNIMVRQGDEVTILDFGIAAIVSEQLGEADATTTTNHPLTAAGQVVGTLGYMSPEQIRGVETGPASDIFSLGTTLYEAATGRNPFLRSGQLQTIAAVLDENPPPIRSIVQGFPSHLDEILLKCLGKRPDLRYADGAALLAALRRPSDDVAPPRARSRYRSIAVLPFANLVGDSDDEYLGEALASEIITKLARLKGVLVLSRSATQRYRDSPLDARQIGRELEAQSVLEGGLSRSGSRCRITVQLLDVDTGFCVWADAFDVTVDDLFHVQEMVSNRVARALRTKFTEPAARRPAPVGGSPEAYRYYLQGKALYYRFNSTDNLLAIEAYRRALAIEPGYAAAHAGIATACIARLEREWESDEARWTSDALQACQRAIAHDPWSSEAYSARGQVFLRQQRLDEAEAELRRALAISASDDIAHSMLGRLQFERGELQLAARSYRRALKISPDYVWCWNDLAWVAWLMGRYQETEKALTKVLTINPVDEIARVGLATGHYFRGELDAAVAAARKSVAINPQHPYARPVLAVALARQGHIEEASDLCKAVLAERPRDFLASAALGLVYAIAGDPGKTTLANEHALKIPADRVPLNLNIAVHYAFLDLPDWARRWLRKAFDEGLRGDIVLRHNPLLHQFAPEFAAHTSRTEESDHARGPAAVPHAHQDL